MRLAVDELLGLQYKPSGKIAIYAWDIIDDIKTETLIFVGITAGKESEPSDKFRVSVF